MIQVVLYTSLIFQQIGMIQRSPTGATSYMAAAPQIIPIKRSKSLGSAADLNNHASHNGNGVHYPSSDTTLTTNAANAINDMAPFSEDVTNKFKQVRFYSYYVFEIYI